MARHLTQELNGPVNREVRPWGLSGFVGKLVVVEIVNHANQSIVEVATGVLEGARRRQNNSGTGTDLVFRGGFSIAYGPDDLVNVTEVEVSS